MSVRLSLGTCLVGLVACSPPAAGTTAQPGSTGEEASSSGTTSGEESTTGTTEEPTTGPSGPLMPVPGESRYALVGEAVVLDGAASTGAVLYQWNPGDGSPASEPSESPVLEVMYAKPGRYKPILTVHDGVGGKLSASVTITVTHPPTWRPRGSATVTRIGDSDRVAVVSPDSDEVMIARGDARQGFEVERRIATLVGPRTVSDAGAWLVVAAQGGDALEFVRHDGQAGHHVLELGYGARPFGVVAHEGVVYAALQGPGRLAVVGFDGEEGPVLKDMIEVGFDARAVALLPDGTVAVTRWRSPKDGGVVSIVDVAAGEVIKTWPLAFDPQQASDTEVGGVPSYLSQVAVSPTTELAALPAIQINIGHGEFFNKKKLEPDLVMRAIVGYVALPAGAELFDRRKQLDNRGMSSAAVFSPRGDYLYVATRGPQTVERLDVFSGDNSGNLFTVGYAPEGLALSADGRLLYVDAYLSRELVVFDTSVFDTPGPPLARLQIPTKEPLAPEILRGKQLFNDSEDDRLSKDNYIACAHCHPPGAPTPSRDHARTSPPPWSPPTPAAPPASKPAPSWDQQVSPPAPPASRRDEPPPAPTPTQSPAPGLNGNHQVSSEPPSAPCEGQHPRAPAPARSSTPPTHERPPAPAPDSPPLTPDRPAARGESAVLSWLSSGGPPSGAPPEDPLAAFEKLLNVDRLLVGASPPVVPPSAPPAVSGPRAGPAPTAPPVDDSMKEEFLFLDRRILRSSAEPTDDDLADDDTDGFPRGPPDEE